MKKIHTDLHTLLIFPPVWNPIGPYPALPVLVGFLKENGYAVSQFDASLDFFISHLLTPSTLRTIKEQIFRRLDAGELDEVSLYSRKLITDLTKADQRLESLLSNPSRLIDRFRDAETFFDPDICIGSQRDMYTILKLVSLAHWPLRLTFNQYLHSLHSFDDMLHHCENRRENLFLSYYDTAIPPLLTSETHLVGISMTSNQQLVAGFSLARWFRQNYPHIHLTLGGRNMIRLKDSFSLSPEFFDYFCSSIIVDNGEKPMLSLIEALKQGTDLVSVPNLTYRGKGGLCENPAGQREPIGRLPTPDYEDLPLHDYLSPTPLVPMRLSEGCYWGKCTFCERNYLHGFSTIPPEVAVEQMAEIHSRFGVNHFAVNDDCLTPLYLEQFSREIIDRRLRIFLSLWCKPVHSFTRHRLNLMHKAGVRMIRWGIETGHPRILKLMNKGTRLEGTLRVLRDASDAGIWNHGCMILGFPTETQEEALTTVDYIAANRDIIHSTYFSEFTLFVHSYIYDHPVEFGLNQLKTRGDDFFTCVDYTNQEGMPPRERKTFLSWARRHIRKDVYNNPFWYHLRLREYIFLFVREYGKDAVQRWTVESDKYVVRDGNSHRFVVS